MNFINKIFYPPFIQKIDRSYLISSPGFWSTRLHRVAWIVFVSALILSAYYSVVPNDPRSDSTVYLPTLLVSLFSVIGFVFWMIYLLRFNSFKRFGPQSPRSFLVEYMAYFSVVFLFVSLPFIPSAVESSRANAAFAYDEIVKETNEMNFLAASLFTDSLQKNWERDTLYVSNEMAPKVEGKLTETETVTENGYINGKHYVVPKELRRLVSSADSSVRVSDTMYVLLSPPDYRFINAGNAEDHAKFKIISEIELYNRVWEGQKSPQREKWNTDFKRLKEKYYNKYSNETVYYSESLEGAPTFLNLLGISTIQDGIDNICSRKNAWQSKNIPDFLRIAFYTSLFISLLVFIFRHTTVKTFFIGILSIFVLSILTGIVLGLIHLSSTSFFVVLLLYYGAFAYLSMRIFSASKRQLTQGIALNAFTVLTVFIPIICVAYYFEIQDQFELEKSVDFNYSEEYLRFKSRMFLLAEFTGIAGLMVLLPSFIYRGYRKWFSLPEE
jgi:hypothetical protein